MKKFFYISAAAMLAAQVFLNTVLAANEIQIQPGNIQISVGGIFLDFTGSNSVLDQLAVSDDGNSITVTVSDSAYAQFISGDKRGFTVSPGSAYAKTTCEATRSTVTLETPSGAPPTDFTITPLATTCISDSGGGGGGGGGSGGGGNVGAGLGALGPIIVTPPATPPQPPVPPVEIPTKLTPPAVTPPVETPLTLAEEFTTPITVPITIEAVQAVGAAASGITGSIGGGISEIIQGILTGFSGEALITKNAPTSPSSIAGATAIGEYAWQTDRPLTSMGPNKPVFEVTPRNDYEIIIYAAADPSIRAVSGRFSLVNKKSLSFLRFKNESLRATLFSEKTGNDQTDNNKASLAAAAGASSPNISIIDPQPGSITDIGNLYAIHWKANNLPGDGSVNIVLTKGFDIGETMTAAYTGAANEVRKLRANPAVTQAIKQVAVPISITITAISAGAITVTASVGSASFVFDISQLLQWLAMLRFYALAFIRFRRRKPWGRVYDKLTGRPLCGAKVQILRNAI